MRQFAIAVPVSAKVFPKNISFCFYAAILLSFPIPRPCSIQIRVQDKSECSQFSVVTRGPNLEYPSPAWRLFYAPSHGLTLLRWMTAMATQSETLHSIIDLAPWSGFLFPNDMIPILVQSSREIYKYYEGAYQSGIVEIASNSFEAIMMNGRPELGFYSIRPSVPFEANRRLVQQETIPVSMGELFYPHILSRNLPSNPSRVITS